MEWWKLKALQTNLSFCSPWNILLRFSWRNWKLWLKFYNFFQSVKLTLYPRISFIIIIISPSLADVVANFSWSGIFNFPGYLRPYHQPCSVLLSCPSWSGLTNQPSNHSINFIPHHTQTTYFTPWRTWYCVCKIFWEPPSMVSHSLLCSFASERITYYYTRLLILSFLP